MYATCKKKNPMILLVVVLIILILSASCGQNTPAPVDTITPGNPTTTPKPPSPIYTNQPVQDENDTLPELDTRIPVGNYKLHIHCMGSGTPAVILEAGWGDAGDTWQFVQPEVGKFTQVCAYDRVGLGSSDPGSEPDTSLKAVTDLHTLLENATIEGPYILVGHSLGGMYMRLYAHQYPEDVVGLVLVDSSHPDTFERNAAVLPPETPNESESIKFYRDWFTSSTKDPTLKPELLEPGSLDNLPLVVLTGTNKQREGLPDELNTKFNQIWVELQEELALLSTNSTHIISPESGHFIQHDKPELVIEAILNILAEVRQ